VLGSRPWSGKRQADGLTRPSEGAVAARLVLGDLVEDSAQDTRFVEFKSLFDVDC
jgi:hypothetical protein